MPNCSFCGKKMSQNEGLMFVKNDGKILWFCSSKCEKNMLKLKRVPRKVKWVRKVS
ncbi:MAG: 50S ribosomal protein L24e [Nanoarchaeota archaeon]|nr:50S ribosomal protein L24e [Nanoarchaeota archaeon]